MRKYFKILTLLSLMILFYQCEQIGVIESDIPYNEVFIVNGRLIGDSSEVQVSFTRSFPIEKDLTIDQVALKDITAYIWTKNQGIFSLKHDKDGIYKPVETLKVRQGAMYELYAKIDDERVFAETLVPYTPAVEEVKLQGDYITCKILPNPSTVYAAKYKVMSIEGFDDNFEETVFFEVSNKVTDTTKAVEFRTSPLPPEFYQESEKYRVSLVVYALDENYKDYFDTRQNNKPIENIFSEGGGSVYWNVQGEKSIGLFIAYTKLELSNIE